MGIIATSVKLLIAAGVTGDALVTAIEELENSQNPVKSIGAIRQHRYRERNKASQSVTNVTSVTPPPSSPSSLLSPIPPYNSTPPSPPPSCAANGNSQAKGETYFSKCREYILEKFPLPQLGASDGSPIHLWESSGYDFEKHVKPVVDAKLLRGAKPSSFSYFTAAIENASQAKMAEAPKPIAKRELTPETQERDKAFFMKTGIHHSIHNPEGSRA